MATHPTAFQVSKNFRSPISPLRTQSNRDNKKGRAESWILNNQREARPRGNASASTTKSSNWMLKSLSWRNNYNPPSTNLTTPWHLWKYQLFTQAAQPWSTPATSPWLRLSSKQKLNCWKSSTWCAASTNSTSRCCPAAEPGHFLSNLNLTTDYVSDGCGSANRAE